MGMLRSDTAALKFDDVPVAGDAILGPIGSGGKVARQVLLRGRVGIAALALGLARDSLERAAAYSKERKVAGGTLFDQPLTQAKLSRMEESLWVAWQGVRSAARFADALKPFKVQACMAKVFATETALRITDEAIQIMGGYGYMRDYKVEQNYRDARLLTIGEGASEILRFAIARNLLDQDRGDMGGVLPHLDSLEVAAGLDRGSIGSLWGPGWRALQLASESVRFVREQVRQACERTDLVSSRQCDAVRFADLATLLWVSFQVVLAVQGSLTVVALPQSIYGWATSFSSILRSKSVTKPRSFSGSGASGMPGYAAITSRRSRSVLLSIVPAPCRSSWNIHRITVYIGRGDQPPMAYEFAATAGEDGRGVVAWISVRVHRDNAFNRASAHRTKRLMTRKHDAVHLRAVVTL